ncbi:unnamed protein product [Colias eurytheme]|nr:unnamed protein product [Colias eurytheme]
MGYKFKKLRSKHLVLIERTDIVAWRFRYLQALQRFRNEPPKTRNYLVYTDETYVHTSYRPQKCWQSPDEPGSSSDISLGERYIVVHPGTEEGFIPIALLVYKSKDNNADFHHDMNKENFKKWVVTKLIPNLPGPSHGHIVQRLPPHHCDLNAIELIWSLAKRRVAEKNINREKAEIPKLIEKAFGSITSNDWRIELGGEDSDASYNSSGVSEISLELVHMSESDTDVISGVEYLEPDFDYDE